MAMSTFLADMSVSLFSEATFDGIGFGLGVMRRKLFLVIWCAAFAQPGLRIPTHIRAHPFAATGALMKVTFGLFHCQGKRIVVCFAANRALNVIGAIACARQNSAEDIPRSAQ